MPMKLTRFKEGGRLLCEATSAVLLKQNSKENGKRKWVDGNRKPFEVAATFKVYFLPLPLFIVTLLYEFLFIFYLFLAF